MGNTAFRKLMRCLAAYPPLYEKSSAPFWDDPHISAQMLTAHLDPKLDAASRPHAFMRASAEWICSCCGAEKSASDGGRKTLLDLGCGPGLYAELFTAGGFAVTGIDCSRRSIAYAMESAAKQGLDIAYECRDYLGIDYENAFDAATLIYCDFGVLSPQDRAALLIKIRRALRPGGRLILDGYAESFGEAFSEGERIQSVNGGFWSAEPYVCVRRNRRYAESGNYLEQYIILTEHNCECYNIWNQLFSEYTLTAELKRAGFGEVMLFADAAGHTYTGGSDTLCAIALCGETPR